MANNIIQFNELGNLPISIDTERLDEDSGIAPTLIEHKARWHKTCKDKFSTLKLQRIEKRKNQEETNAPQPFKFTRTSSGASTSKAEMGCFFCGGTSETLHQASTFNVDDSVPQCTFQLQDKVLIAKLSAGDLISQEAIYHAKCLVSLYNKAGRLNQNTEDGDEKIIEGIALAQLVAHIEESRAESVDIVFPCSG